MAKLTRAEAAQIKGTSRASITQAVRRGRLKSGKDKSIDPDHPINSKYFKAAPADGHRGGGRRAGLGVDAVKSKAEIERRLKRLKCEELELKNALKRKELAPVLSARRTMADLGGILGVHFLHLPRRMVSMIVAKVKRGETAQDIEQYLTAEITRSIENFKQAAISKFQEHIAEMDKEDADAKKKE